jgi:adenosylmethionine-8-amino-7-oxononanoate aminotransferase
VCPFSQVGLDSSEHPIEPNDTFVPVFPDDGDEGRIQAQMERLRTRASQLSVTAFFFESFIAGKAMQSPSRLWWKRMAELCRELKIIMVADESLLG